MAKAVVERTTARDWLAFCAEDAGLAMGDEPIVLVSYAGEDLRYVEKLRKHLDVALPRVKSDGRAFSAWDYARHRSGTSLGGHFPTQVATQMWRCRAAIVILSPDYANSRFCFEIELPFLLWRMQHYNMRLFILRLNSTVVDHDLFELPDYRFAPEKINLMHYVDDRNPSLMDRFDTHSEKMLKELDSERPDKAEARLVAYVRAICELLSLDEERRLSAAAGSVDAPEMPRRPDAADDLYLLEKRHANRMQATRPKPDPVVKWAIGLSAIALALVGLGLGGHAYLSERPAPAPVTTVTPKSESQIGREATLKANHGASPAPAPAGAVTIPDLASAKLACQLAAGSPADPAISPDAAVPFERLDPARLTICEKAASLDPTDGALAFEMARLLDKAGRTRQAFERYLDAYGKGSALAANNIGVLYRDQSAIFSAVNDATSCVSANDCDEHAVDWFGKAVERGVVASHYNLGLMYEAQRGVSDPASPYACATNCDMRAIDEFQHAAEIGDADAALHLGWLYLQERGVVGRSDTIGCRAKTDCDQKGLAWLNKALAAGAPDAKAFADALYRARPDLKLQVQ